MTTLFYPIFVYLDSKLWTEFIRKKPNRISRIHCISPSHKIVVAGVLGLPDPIRKQTSMLGFLVTNLLTTNLKEKWNVKDREGESIQWKAYGKSISTEVVLREQEGEKRNDDDESLHWNCCDGKVDKYNGIYWIVMQNALVRYVCVFDSITICSVCCYFANGKWRMMNMWMKQCSIRNKMMEFRWERDKIASQKVKS